MQAPTLADTIRSVFISVGGRQTFVMDVGSGGEAVVLHSGWIGTWEDWAPQLAALSRQRRVVAFDHRGAGRTCGAPDEVSIERLVDDLFDVLDALAVDRCVLGGFSTGSQVVQHALHRSPQRFSALLLMCPSGDAAPDPAFLALLEADFDAAIRQFLTACLPEAAEQNVEPVRKWAHDVLHQSDSASAVHLLRAMMSPSPAIAGVRLPDVPVLVLQGDADPFSPVEYGRLLAERFPSAGRHHVLHGAGHLLAMTRPQETLDAMERFLASF